MQFLWTALKISCTIEEVLKTELFLSPISLLQLKVFSLIP